MHIRPFRAEDAEQVRSFYSALYKSYQSSISPEHLKKYGEYKDFDATIDFALGLENTADWKTFVAEASDGKLIGFISGSIDSIPYHKLDKFGMVENFFVEDGSQGQGIGRQLYECLEGWFREKGCKVAKTDTWVFNKSAIETYKKLGFKKLAILFIKDIP